MKDKFIVENEREFWLLRKNRQEQRIKYFIQMGIKVVMNDGYVVGIIGLKPINKEYTKEIICLAEEYCKTLEEIKGETK